MSRIRSIHPGLSTDENYMALGHAAARVLPHLWCECDDRGVFEWKPLTLKAKILPAHNESMEEILGELMAREFVARFTSNGKSYGAVRNFCRYQRPKKPKYVHPILDELRTYVGLTGNGPEPEEDETQTVPHQFPTQPADGGGRMEEEGGDSESESETPSMSASTPDGARPPKYSFSGDVIKLNTKDYQKLRKQFRALNGTFEGELAKADAYYRDHPPKNGKYWFPLTKWLERAQREVTGQPEENSW